MDSVRQNSYTSSYGLEPSRHDYWEDNVYASSACRSTLEIQGTDGEMASTGECNASQRTQIESASLSNQSSSFGISYGTSHNNVLPVSCRETLLEHAHSFIAQINEKRAADIKLLGDFRNAMDIQANKVCEFLQREIIAVYEKDTQRIQLMLYELFATLDRIRDIEVEFLQFRDAFQVFFQQLQQDD